MEFKIQSLVIIVIPTYLYAVTMLFRHEELVEREIEIGGYLVQGLSLTQISQKTNLSKKMIVAHLHNMMEKLKTNGLEDLIRVLK